MSEVSIFKKRTRNNILNKAQLYHKVEGQEDPISAGQYDGMSWLDCEEDQCPMFSAEEGKWFFDGSQKDIETLISSVNLTHEFGPKKGQRIEVKDVNLYNDADPLFNHSALKRQTEKSKLTVDHSKPLDQFLYLCLIALEDTLRPDNDNPAVAGDTRYEVLEAGYEEKLEEKKIHSKMEANSAIFNMDHNKRLTIARALNHPLFYPNSDIKPESLQQTLYLRIVEEGNDLKDESGVSYLDKFMAFAEMTKRELEIREILTSALKKGVVSSRRDGNFYLFRDNEISEIIPGIKSETELIEMLKTKDGIKLQNEDDLLSFLRKKFTESE